MWRLRKTAVVRLVKRKACRQLVDCGLVTGRQYVGQGRLDGVASLEDQALGGRRLDEGGG